MRLFLFSIVTFSMAVANPIPEDAITTDPVTINSLPEVATASMDLIESNDPDITLFGIATSGANVKQSHEPAIL